MEEKKLTLGQKLEQVSIMFEAAEMYHSYASADLRKATKVYEASLKYKGEKQRKLLSKACSLAGKAEHEIASSLRAYEHAVIYCDNFNLDGRKTTAKIRYDATEKIVSEFKPQITTIKEAYAKLSNPTV